MAAKRTTKKKAAPAKKKAAKKAAPARKKTPVIALTPDDLAARIAATGLVETAYVLPWAAIGGPGSYVHIVKALRDLAGGDFPAEDVTDAVEKKHASLELTLDGVCHVLDAQVKGAKVDDGVLVMLASLFDLRQQKRSAEAQRRFLIDTSTCKASHTYLIVCATMEQLSAINAATGAAFIKMTQL